MTQSLLPIRAHILLSGPMQAGQSFIATELIYDATHDQGTVIFLADTATDVLDQQQGFYSYQHAKSGKTFHLPNVFGTVWPSCKLVDEVERFMQIGGHSWPLIIVRDISRRPHVLSASDQDQWRRAAITLMQAYRCCVLTVAHKGPSGRDTMEICASATWTLTEHFNVTEHGVPMPTFGHVAQLTRPNASPIIFQSQDGPVRTYAWKIEEEKSHV